LKLGRKEENFKRWDNLKSGKQSRNLVESRRFAVGKFVEIKRNRIRKKEKTIVEENGRDRQGRQGSGKKRNALGETRVNRLLAEDGPGVFRGGERGQVESGDKTPLKERYKTTGGGK